MPYDREGLRRLLIERAIVLSSSRQPLFDRHGRPIPWVYYGGELCLSSDGLDLMARAILDRLRGFSSTQIATYGQSAVPILAACIALSDGRHSGLVIRKTRKDYGVRRQIDGPLDRARPVVVIDESITSGSSACHAIAALEREGMTVEGVICVVEFTGYGAAEWLRSCGYRVETIFNVWTDLERTPSRKAHPPTDVDWASERLASNLAPAQAVRQTAEIFLRKGLAPRPPEAFDRDYDGSGGVFVSIRRRDDDYRIARSGLWLSELETVDTPTAVVLAGIKALDEAAQTGLDDLSRIKFAVSMFSGMEPIGPAEIDHERFALVVRGRGPLDRIGFALPNSPQHDDPLEQYRYARTVSASFSTFEPHDLYRQRVERSLEPGDTWPADGAPRPHRDWTSEPALVNAIERRVRVLLEQDGTRSGHSRTAIPVLPEPIFGVGVTLYRNGIAGCSISTARDLDAAIAEALKAALADARYQAKREQETGPFSAVVSVLTRRRLLGRLAPERIRLFYRLGRDTLQAAAGGRSGFVLAHFPVHQSVSPEQYRDQVLLKAGVASAEAQWTTFETIAFVVRPDLAAPLELGFPTRDCAADSRNHWLELGGKVAHFVLAQRGENGLPAYLANPWDGSMTMAGTATRILLALNGLLEFGAVADASLQTQAEAMVELMIACRRKGGASDLVWDAGSDAQLLQCLALMQGRAKHLALAQELCSRLQQLVRRDGAIHAGPSRPTADLDLLSGSALLALASSGWVPGALDGLDMPRILGFYRRRFELVQPWGMVWWHARAWNALADRSAEFARFADELLHWAIERQSKLTGAFLIHSMEPHRSSFLSACILEAIGDSWLRASRTSNADLAATYAAAWTKGAKFVERLVLNDADCYFTADPEKFVGGVRATLASSALRIDYSGHMLLALAKGLRASAADSGLQDQKKAGSSAFAADVAGSGSVAAIASATERPR